MCIMLYLSILIFINIHMSQHAHIATADTFSNLRCFMCMLSGSIAVHCGLGYTALRAGEGWEEGCGLRHECM